MPDEYSGKVVEVFRYLWRHHDEHGYLGYVTHLEFKIPTRGIMGLKNRIMNVTHGEGVFPHLPEYGPLRRRDRQPSERRNDLHDHREGRCPML